MRRAPRPAPSRLRSAAQLKASTELATAHRLLQAYQPWSAEQEQVRTAILAFIAAHDDAALRTCVPGHLTASALVLSSDGSKNLLTHHRKLRRWLQLGGHCDGDTNFVNVALKEATEESGIEELRIDTRIVDLDIHTIPARPATSGPLEKPAEPEHLHLDVRYAVWAPEGAREVVSEESLELAWVAMDEMLLIDTDDSVRRVAAQLLAQRD